MPNYEVTITTSTTEIVIVEADDRDTALVMARHRGDVPVIFSEVTTGSVEHVREMSPDPADG